MANIDTDIPGGGGTTPGGGGTIEVRSLNGKPVYYTKATDTYSYQGPSGQWLYSVGKHPDGGTVNTPPPPTKDPPSPNEIDPPGTKTGSSSTGGGSTSGSVTWSDPFLFNGQYVQTDSNGYMRVVTEAPAANGTWAPPYTDQWGNIVQQSPDGRVFVLGKAPSAPGADPKAGPVRTDLVPGHYAQEMPDGTVRILAQTPTSKPQTYGPSAAQTARSDAANAALLQQRMQLEAQQAERAAAQAEAELELARARLDLEGERVAIEKRRFALEKKAQAEQQAKTYAELLSSYDLGALPAFLGAGGGSVVNALGSGANMLTDAALTPAALLSGKKGAGGGGGGGGAGGGAGAGEGSGEGETPGGTDGGTPSPAVPEERQEWLAERPGAAGLMNDPYNALLNQMLRDPESPVHHMNPAEQQAFVRGRISNDAPRYAQANAAGQTIYRSTPPAPAAPANYGDTPMAGAVAAQPTGADGTTVWTTGNPSGPVWKQTPDGKWTFTTPDPNQPDSQQPTQTPKMATGGTTEAKTFITGDPQVPGRPNPELTQLEGPRQALEKVRARVTPLNGITPLRQQVTGATTASAPTGGGASPQLPAPPWMPPRPPMPEPISIEQWRQGIRPMRPPMAAPMRPTPEQVAAYRQTVMDYIGGLGPGAGYAISLPGMKPLRRPGMERPVQAQPIPGSGFAASSDGAQSEPPGSVGGENWMGGAEMPARSLAPEAIAAYAEKQRLYGRPETGRPTFPAFAFGTAFKPFRRMLGGGGGGGLFGGGGQTTPGSTPGVEGGTGNGTTPVPTTNDSTASPAQLAAARGDRLQTGFSFPGINPWSLEFQRQSPTVQKIILADYQRLLGIPSEHLGFDIGFRALRGGFGNRAVGY